MQYPVRWLTFSRLYAYLHTADTDKTKLSCLVLSVSAVWTELVTRQNSFVLSQNAVWTEFVLSRFQFATVQSQTYWGLLKTVLTCRQFSSSHRHGQNNIVLSCCCWRCEIGITVQWTVTFGWFPWRDCERLSVLDILWTADEVEHDAARVAGTVRGVSCLLPDVAAPQSTACTRFHRRAICCCVPPVLPWTHQLNTPSSLRHGSPDYLRAACQCRPGVLLDLQQHNRRLPTQTTGNAHTHDFSRFLTFSWLFNVFLCFK